LSVLLLHLQGGNVVTSVLVFVCLFVCRWTVLHENDMADLHETSWDYRFLLWTYEKYWL